ncbi:hypothetical protein ACTA71_000377 [Dictyostelium dimigraforme]
MDMKQDKPPIHPQSMYTPPQLNATYNPPSAHPLTYNHQPPVMNTQQSPQQQQQHYHPPQPYQQPQQQHYRPPQPYQQHYIPPQQQQQQQQQQHPYTQQNVMVPNFGQIDIKHTIEPKLGWFGESAGFDCNLMPNQMKNYLSDHEYSYIVKCLDEYVKAFKKKNLFIMTAYLISIFIMVIVMISVVQVAPAVTYVFLSLVFFISIGYIAWSYIRLGGINRDLAKITTELNNEYGSRHIRVEAYRDTSQLVFTVKASIYYPQTVQILQAPQINNNQSTLQFIKSPSVSQQPQFPQQKEEEENKLDDSDTAPLL